MTIRDAARTSAKPLVGIYSESGAGKTYTSLLLARGYVGPKGRIIMVETEGGRGESYADPQEYPELAGEGQTSNYRVISLTDDFSPKAYGGAISEAEAAKPDALIIDSASHEWEGVGGVLSMAAANEQAGKKGVLVWQQPKIQHSREFMLRFMQTPIPLVILSMRAKYPMEQKLKNGKLDWARSESLEPKQSEDILYEMFIHGWISQGSHNFNLTKCTARRLESVFVSGKPITLETGREFAAWAKGAAPSTQQAQPTQSPAQRMEAAKAELLEAAEGGEAVLALAWDKLADKQRLALKLYYEQTLLPAAKKADEEAEQQEDEEPADKIPADDETDF